MLTRLVLIDVDEVGDIVGDLAVDWKLKNHTTAEDGTASAGPAEVDKIPNVMRYLIDTLKKVGP